MEQLWIILTLQTEQISNSINVSTLLNQAGPVVKFVILILLLMSIICWAIIFSKMITLRSASRKSSRFLNLYDSSNNFGTLYSSTRHIGGPIAELFRSGYSEVMKTKKVRNSTPKGADASSQAEGIVERALKKTMTIETSKLENSLTFLATTGSTAPFIGLFGTVWGIMTSFIGLAGSQGVPSLQVVAPGIAEALIATAIGLAAAIPGAVAYNYFISKVRKIDLEMENFSADFLNIVERYFNR